MLFTRTNPIDIDSWYKTQLMVKTGTHVIVLVLLSHTCAKGQGLHECGIFQCIKCFRSVHDNVIYIPSLWGRLNGWSFEQSRREVQEGMTNILKIPGFLSTCWKKSEHALQLIKY